MAKLGKRLKNINEKLDIENIYNIDEAIKLIKENATAKFDESIDVILNLNVDPKYQDQNIREVVQMPEGLGKKVRVAVIANSTKLEEATKAGAELVGSDDLVEEIKKGKIDFDFCIATPDMMAVVGRLGKVLGPRNLMPNPKVGTVTVDVEKAVKSAKSGEVQFKVEKSGVLQAGLGKVSFDKQKISENITAFIESVNKAKPAGAKGTYLKKITVSSTMGPSVTIDSNQFAN